MYRNLPKPSYPHIIPQCPPKPFTQPCPTHGWETNNGNNDISYISQVAMISFSLHIFYFLFISYFSKVFTQSGLAHGFRALMQFKYFATLVVVGKRTSGNRISKNLFGNFIFSRKIYFRRNNPTSKSQRTLSVRKSLYFVRKTMASEIFVISKRRKLSLNITLGPLGSGIGYCWIDL